jgi:UDP-N-acetylmuramoylalanine--D-glutamate ligase
MNFLAQQSVLVIGLGESGLAMVRFCLTAGARISVLDTRAQPPGLDALRALSADAVVMQACEDFAAYDRVLVSPGLNPSESPLSQAIAQRNAVGKRVESEIEVFALALAELATVRHYKPRVLGITGTNGKTTTTSLTRLLCERAGKRVRMAGNISPAALDVLLECLAADELPDVWVLELSSFQLFSTYSLVCDAATVLNLTQDHLDWHGSMEAYAAAKAKIFAPATTPVINRDDPWVSRMAAPANGFSFGAGEPVQANSFGLLRENGLTWLVLAQAAPQEGGRRRKDEPVPFTVNRLMPMDALHIRGVHNAVNAMAALALCRAIDLPMSDLLHGLRQYHGEPHRVEFVTQVNGVDFFDDSKGTNVGATVAALTGLERTVVLIAGGDGKGQSFEPLAAPVSRHARAVVLIGKDAGAIETALAACGVALFRADTLEQATRQAADLAVAGDAVLLSPACASLDMFRNYAHRAEVFVTEVKSLAQDAGQPC